MRPYTSRRRSHPIPRARVAVRLALAHTIQRAIDRGEIRDQAEAARRLGVIRARITQIMDLTFLAPELQETILFVCAGDEAASERALRRTVQATSWAEQRQL